MAGQEDHIPPGPAPRDTEDPVSHVVCEALIRSEGRNDDTADDDTVEHDDTVEREAERDGGGSRRRHGTADGLRRFGLRGGVE